MNNDNIAIITFSSESRETALKIQTALPSMILYTTKEGEEAGSFRPIVSLQQECGEILKKHDVVIFCCALGICVRSIAPYLSDKHSDPAILCIDTTGRFVISVASGHVGGANFWAARLAHILGAEPVITTQSDRQGLWALDLLGDKWGWKTETRDCTLNEAISLFVEKKHTALLLEGRSEGSGYLERTKPEHVDIYYRINDVDFSKYDLLIAVSYREYVSVSIPQLYYRPQVLHLGVGCRRDASPESVSAYIIEGIRERGYATSSIASISSIELKRGEPLIADLAQQLGVPENFFSAEQLDEIDVPNPSDKVAAVTGSSSVSEASARFAAHGGPLLIEKQKGCLHEGSDFTYSLAVEPSALTHGHIEIVGAGPGDPELVTVRGKYFLERADLILYAGSLVPIELTYYAKKGATVRSSADLSLEEQFALMKEFYDRHCLVVRLHTGDPAIFGAIQEQMALFDEAGMSYHITPGVSSFLAAAAELRSQFTIPERVQTIILTRGEGRTPMPEREQLHKLAASQSTMCIYLSASIVDQVQQELLVHYPPTTPVAVCYKLTWKDQKIFRGQLSDLAKIVHDNKLTLTTLMVVGEAIDNRYGLSRLYSDEFKHLFRP